MKRAKKYYGRKTKSKTNYNDEILIKPNRFVYIRNYLKGYFLQYKKGFILFITSCILLIIFIFSTSNLPRQISTEILFNGNISFNTVESTDDIKSPLCGCLSGDVEHNGIMNFAKKIKLNCKRINYDVNFLVTAPDVDGNGPNPSFSFKYTYYQYKKAPLIPYNVKDLIESKTTPKGFKLINKTINNSSAFVGIINKGELNIILDENQPISAMVPSENSLIEILSKKNKYSATNLKYSIMEKLRITNDDSKRVFPHLDVLGPKLILYSELKCNILDQQYLVWKPTNSCKSIINSLSEKKIIKGNKIKNYYSVDTSLKDNDVLNILVIEPPFAARITYLPWSDDINRQWNNKCIEDLNKSMGILDLHGGFYKFMGRFIFSNLNLEFVPKNYDLIFTPPMYYLDKDSAEISYNFDNIISNSDYSCLLNKYKKENGVYIKFPKGSKQYYTGYIQKTNTTLPNVLSYVYSNQYNNKLTNADQLYENQLKIIHSTLKTPDSYFAFVDTFFNAPIEEYFRYPPLQKDLGIVVFNKFASVDIEEGKGEFMIGSKNTSVSKKSNVSLSIVDYSKLSNPSFNYVLDENGFTNLQYSGNGEVKIDGELLKETFLDKKLFTDFNAFVTLISGVLTIISLFAFIISIVKISGVKHNN